LKVAALTSAADGEPLLEGITPYADLHVLPAESTSTFENIYTPQGRIQYIRGVAARITSKDVPQEWRPAPLVHLAPLTDEVDPQIAHLFPDATVLLTLQGWLRRWDADGRVRFKRWCDPSVLKSIDIVVFSEEDVLEAPELEREMAESVRRLVVTRAERGGTLYFEGNPSPYSTPQVELVHPTGAGDVFAAALLSALHLLDGDMATAPGAAAIATNSVLRVLLDSSPASGSAGRAGAGL
jgi:sugar/nucleoside kinase (ribokinase family)